MRSTTVRVDQYGIDPLSDTLFERLNEITAYTDHTVTEDERSNPQLIAYRKYQDVNKYCVILAFNGIGNSFEIVPGMNLRIPSPVEVNTIFAQEKSKPVSRRTRL